MFAQRLFTFAVGVALLLAFAATGQAQSGRGAVIVEGVPPNVSVMLEINGVKPPGADAVASAGGIAEMVLNYANTPKPEGFKAQVYVDICRNGVIVRVVLEGATVPPPTDDCIRRSRGTIEFRPHSPTRINAAQPVTALPTALLGGGFTVNDNDLTFTQHKEEFNDQVRNQTINETVEEIPTNFNMNLDTEVSGTQGVVPLPGSQLYGNIGFAALNDSAAAAGNRSRLVTHHAIVSIGRGDATLHFNNTTDPGASVRWNGSGTVWGLGYGALIEVCDRCGWFANASYLYSQMQRSTMQRSRVLDTFGGTITRDEASFEWNAHRVEATIGKAIGRVFPYAGVRTTVREATLKGNVDVDFSSRFGFTAISRTAFTNAFEDTAVQALFGAQVQVPRTRLFVRAEGAAGDGGAGFGFNVGYGWY
jgi:hypothetical protein